MYQSRLQGQVWVQFKFGHPILPRYHFLLLRVDVEVEHDAVGRELDRLVLVQPPLGELRPVFIVSRDSIVITRDCKKLAFLRARAFELLRA